MSTPPPPPPPAPPAPPAPTKISIEIAPTTGGSFDFLVDPEDSIDFIKKCIAKKLKVGKEQICLLHRDRLLESTKTVRDYGLADGSRLSLVPTIETGLVTQRPEQSVLEALEGLNESQVGDFLSGKSPLNLTMRLGDHVMLIQLQLSRGQQQQTQQQSGGGGTPTGDSEAVTPTSAAVPTPTTTPPTAEAAEAVAGPSTSTSSNPSSLVEASRNLTNTLKKLSSHVTTPTTPTTAEKKKPQRKRRKEEVQHEGDKKVPITNHMQHHGKGVYSGTFSGTLNPALQDGLTGKPKKHVSTIVHILNDLLGGVQAGATTNSSSTKKKKRHHHHNNQNNNNTTSDNSAVPEPPPTEEERALENEALRVKMEALREQLRIRREKLLRSNCSNNNIEENQVNS